MARFPDRSRRGPRRVAACGRGKTSVSCRFLEALAVTDPLVTIVTPSYNQGRFIRATIESVLDQDYPHIEYIILDAGSMDETEAVVQSYARRLTFTREPDKGQADAINKGFRRAAGSILAWLNSDDMLLPGAVGAAVAALQRHPAAGLVYGEGYFIDEQGSPQGRFPHTEPPNLWKLVHLSDFILQQTVFFRRSAIEAVGFLDETLHYAMDWDVFIRIGLRQPLAYIPHHLACMRIHANTKTSTGGMRRWKELHAMLRKHSGMRLPPGSIVYGAAPGADFCCEWLDRKLPKTLRSLARPLKSAVRSCTGRWAGRIICKSQGLHPGGWAGRILHYMLPPGGHCIRIAGQMPKLERGSKTQTLRVECNGHDLGSYRLAFGDFDVRLAVPAGLIGAVISLKIRAARAFAPSDLGLAGNRPRLAYQLRAIEWA